MLRLLRPQPPFTLHLPHDLALTIATNHTLPGNQAVYLRKLLEPTKPLHLNRDLRDTLSIPRLCVLLQPQRRSALLELRLQWVDDEYPEP
jgi:hypothetical protein